MPDSESENKGFWSHPLTVLLVRTILSAVLIPPISNRVDHQRLINEID
jgi:hypothetical protein